MTRQTSRIPRPAQVRVLAAALEAVANGVVITDRTGRILWVNPAFTVMTGYTAEEAVGQNPRILKSGHQTPPSTRTYGRPSWRVRSGRERSSTAARTAPCTLTS